MPYQMNRNIDSFPYRITKSKGAKIYKVVFKCLSNFRIFVVVVARLRNLVELSH